MTTLAQVFIFHFIFFNPVGNQDLHKSMDEFEFRSDPITLFFCFVALRPKSTARLGVNYFEKVINYLQLHWKLFN